MSPWKETENKNAYSHTHIPKVYDVKNIRLDKSNPAVWKLKYTQADFIVEGEKERNRWR